MIPKDFKNSIGRLMWWLFVATRGGEMRLRIMKSIMENPKNANQLSSEVGVNYRTIEHHLKVLVENHLVMIMGNGYGKTYFLGEIAQNNSNILEEIMNQSNMKGRVN